jgi:hypothetical protein
MKETARETLAIGVGLGALGLAAGAISGATVTAGASQALITGVLTFVGGAVLSYSAFAAKQQAVKRAKKDGEPEPGPANVVRIGAGLTALSLALMAGAVLGMWFRYRDPLGFTPAPAAPFVVVHGCPGAEAAPAAPQSSAASMGMQHGPGENSEPVKLARRRLAEKFYGDGTPVAKDIAALVDLAVRCAPP